MFVNGLWWGYLGFDENEREREWSQGEIEALRAAAGTLGSAIQRGIVERRLSDAEDQHRRLVEKIPAVLYTDAIDESSTALYISPQIEELIGYTAGERMENPRLWVDHLHPDDRAGVLAESERTNREGQPFKMDYRMVARDGRTVWVRDEATMVRDEAGTPLFWQGVMIDITERKRGEEELAHALQLEREAADRLRSLDEMKNTFLTAVSHDLRTPLAAVLGLALTLEREDIDLGAEETRDLAHRIATNARKLDRLVMDLLDLDRLSRGILEPKLTRCDVGSVVREVVDEADFLAEHPVSVETEPAVAFVDQAKVERIAENLLANAVRHTPSGTQVWVKVGPAPEGGALIAVEDAGPGVEPFRQIAGTPVSDHSPGVGIGLSLVARFAELHGGRAWVDDRPGGGASFKVWLPERADSAKDGGDVPAGGLVRRAESGGALPD
jgi:PAS domain S-box-containing protein